MLAKRIIPCLDVTGGRVVKGVNFVELRDAGDPVEIAARYNEQGADELTFLDITATSDGRDLILHIIEAVASQVFIPLTVGGGVRSVEDVRRLLNAGADKTSFNSAAIANPQVIRDASAKYGSQCIVVAIDAKRRNPEEEQRPDADGRPMGPGWDVFSHGGRRNVGLDAVQWARRMAEFGAGAERTDAVLEQVHAVEAGVFREVVDLAAQFVELAGELRARRAFRPGDRGLRERLHLLERRFDRFEALQIGRAHV